MKYFNGCKDLDELKNRYRELCKQHHPDLGGDLRTMQEVNAEYEVCLKNGLKNCENFEARMDIERELAEAIQRLVVVPGVKIEICGKWAWVTGNTYPVKDVLKGIGCKFASKKKAWYWRSENDAVQSRKTISLDEIRYKYGSVEVQGHGQYAIA